MGYLELYDPQDIYCPQEEWDKGHTTHKSMGGVSWSFGPVLLATALQPQETGLQEPPSCFLEGEGLSLIWHLWGASYLLPWRVCHTL